MTQSGCARIWNLGLAYSYGFGGAINPVGIAITLGVASLGLTALFGNCATAQIVPDRTLKSEGSVVTPNVPINALPADRIDGGAVRGDNLFHSFSEFNVGEGQRVYFNNPTASVNIFSRVTGTNPSNILGTLGVINGNATLFLINPNGIIFGPNATLDVSGSFVASSSDSLVFKNGFEFSATNPEVPPLLTINIPVGLQFRKFAGSITNESGVLEVKPGKTLALVGGDVTLRGGNLFAFNGHIELGSVAGNSRVDLRPIEAGWSLSYDNVQNFQDIKLTQAQRAIDSENDFATILNGGNIQVQGRSLALTNGRQIFASRTMTVNASEAVEILGRSPLSRPGMRTFSRLESGAFSAADAGTITINTRKLIVREGGSVSTRAGGSRIDNMTSIPASGKGGEIIVNASSVDLMDDGSGLFSETGSFGAAGNVTINTRKLIVRNGARVSAASVGEKLLGLPIATGKGGDIHIIAPESVELNGGFISTETRGLGGDAGNLRIETGQLIVRDGAEVSVSSKGTGAAGNLEVNARSIRLDNRGNVIAETRAGEGNVTLQSREIILRHNSKIDTDATGEVSGGNITINTDVLAALENSDITANAQAAEGGRVSINAQGIFGTQFREQPTEESDITATSVLGPKFSGTVELNTPEVDPSGGLIELPDNVVNPAALVAQNPCKRGRESEFTITGRGGLPPSPKDALSSEATGVSLVEPAPMASSGAGERTSFTPSSVAKPIMPAQGWVFNALNEVVLTAYNSTVTGPQRLRRNSVGCPAP